MTILEAANSGKEFRAYGDYEWLKVQNNHICTVKDGHQISLAITDIERTDWEIKS